MGALASSPQPSSCAPFSRSAAERRSEDWPALEIAWTLGRPWRQGYAIAAHGGREALRPDPLLNVVALDNTASARLARRLGCTAGEALTIKGTACIVFDYPLNP